MKRFNIGVDVDGVLANFTKTARELCKHLFAGRPDDSLVQTDWGFTCLGLTPAEEDLMWRVIDYCPDWWRLLEKNLKTNSLIELAAHHRVVFITNRKDGAGHPVDQQTQHWLRRMYGIEHPVVVLSNKKAPVAEGLNLHYFIDDRPKNVHEVANGAKNCITYMLNASFNQNDWWTQRVDTFDEFSKRIFERSRED